MKIQSLFLCLLAAASISSCKDDYENTVDVKEVNVKLCAFEDDSIDTRSSYTNSTNGIEGVWAEGDILGIYPIGGDQVAFPISDGIGTNTAKFDGGSWALRSAILYAAYYPFSANNYTISETEIPVSYLGQEQNGNGSLSHLSNYDYMASAATEPSANGSVNLVMKHLGSFAHLQFTMPSAGTYTSIDVKTDAGAFITKGQVDLSSAAPSVSSVEASTSFHFKLNNVTLSNEDKVLKAYMLVAPVNLSTATLTFTVTDSNGATYEATATGKNFTANKNYMFRLSPSPTGTGGTMEGGGGFEEDDDTPNMHNGHEYVDLGLKNGQYNRTIYWATCNLGAESPEDFGDYFAWGETEPYYQAGHEQDNPCSAWKEGKTGYNWASYKWCNGSETTLTKYCSRSDYGEVDNKQSLESEDDAAHINWGGEWIIPNWAFLYQLRTECDWTWTSRNGVTGYEVKSRTNQNSIFLPAAGYRDGTDFKEDGTKGNYWASSISNVFYANELYFSSEEKGQASNTRNLGFSIRPVCILSE